MAASQRLAGLTQNDSGGGDPPDVQVAAGSGYVVEVVNTAMRVWLAADGTPAELSTRTLDAVFGRGSDDLTDPRIVYDAPSGRWFVSISDIAEHAVLLAVSTDADPTGSWKVYTFRVSSDCLDQPRLGLSDDVVVLAADLFASCLTFRALGDGSGVRPRVTVSARGKVVFERTTGPGPLHAQHVYGVTWRTPRSLRGGLRFCVRSVLADGRRSASSCAAFRLRQPRRSSRRSA
jgi:hypothetical protein